MKSDDLISRQAEINTAIDMFDCCDTCDIVDYRDLIVDYRDLMIEALSVLPSAQPERKKGKWKLNKDGNWACPFCEFDPYHDNMKGMNYCPNCGAKMDGKERR